MCKTARLVLLLLLLACPGVARAAWSNDPAVNTPMNSRVTHFADGWQLLASDGEGGCFLAWGLALDSATTGIDLHLQHFDARGRRCWPSDYAIEKPNTQDPLDMVPDGEGGVIVVWHEAAYPEDSDLGMQRVNAQGVPLWGPMGRVLCGTESGQGGARAVADGLGGMYVVWEDAPMVEGSRSDIRAQHVDASGALLWPAEGADVCTQADQQYLAIPVLAADGGLIVQWDDLRYNTGPSSVMNHFMQRLDRSGNKLWAADGVRMHIPLGSYEAIPVADPEGGAYLVWLESAAVGAVLRAQHLSASGTERWAAGGVAVANTVSWFFYFKAASDAAGNLCVAWNDSSSGQWRVTAQKYDGAGAPQWGALGRLVLASSAPRYLVAGRMDTGGGFFLGLSSSEPDYWYYTLKLNAAGLPAWSQPVLTCSAPSDRSNLCMVSDLAGGTILSWFDWRPGSVGPYLQRVDRWGQLGAQPNLTQVIDAPDDQGGYVQATWTKSPLDTPPSAGVNKYRFWREVPTLAAQARAMRGARVLGEGDDVPEGGAPALLQLTSANGVPEYWEYVGEMLADGRALYTASIATASDSVPGANPKTQFMIEGRRGDGTQWWYSDPMLGTSADNLAPASPASFFAVWSAGQSKLHWPKSLESDFKEYRIYAGDWPNFTPSASNLVATVSDTGYTHAAAHPTGYKIVAVDMHGNASAARWTAPSGTTGVDDAPPVAFAFAPVSPNPMRGEAALRFALPVEAHVTLAVYDAQGRRVRTWADGALPAGEHTLRWEGDDDAGRALAAGLYFVRFEAAGRTFVRRCVVAP